jgi:hypothetical protein
MPLCRLFERDLPHALSLRSCARATNDFTPDAALLDEAFQSAQWVLNSEIAGSLVQMAARGASGNAASWPTRLRKMANGRFR